MKQRLILALASTLLTVLGVEGTLRLAMPLPEGANYYYQHNAPWLVTHRVPDNTGRYVRGEWGQINAVFHINNEGWNSTQDYHPARRDTPRIAVIGDSYVEAEQVDVWAAFPEVAQAARPDLEIYRFGIGGASLTQYRHMAGYVRDRFAPDGVVVLLTWNDYNESLQTIYEGRFWEVAYRDGAWLDVPPGDVRLRVEISPAPPPRLALVRYLDHLTFWSGVTVPAVPDPLTPAQRLALVQHELAALQTVTGGRLALMIPDDDRHREARMVAAALDIDVIDLAPYFAAATEPTDFLPLDGHWNDYGHELAAQALTDYLRAWSRE